MTEKHSLPEVLAMATSAGCTRYQDDCAFHARELATVIRKLTAEYPAETLHKQDYEITMHSDGTIEARSPSHYVWCYS
jgi:hypothetical protein